MYLEGNTVAALKHMQENQCDYKLHKKKFNGVTNQPFFVETSTGS